jgi:hypothetical protein
MSDIEREKTDSQEIWVNTTEATEITGYNYHSVRKLITRFGNQPEAERAIKMRRRSTGWELWLPDLIAYLEKPRPGPRIKSKKTD